MSVESYDEVWAVKASRIHDYFSSLDGLICKSSDTYSYTGAEVTVSELDARSLGSLVFFQTRVIITGLNAERFHDAFKLQFLSGGA